MKILVAGAAGQVGCRLVRQLLERNHEVRGTVLPDDPARWNVCTGWTSNWPQVI